MKNSTKPKKVQTKNLLAIAYCENCKHLFEDCLVSLYPSQDMTIDTFTLFYRTYVKEFTGEEKREFKCTRYNKDFTFDEEKEHDPWKNALNQARRR